MNSKIKFHHLLLMGALALGSCQKEYVKPMPVVPPPVGVKFCTDIAPSLVSCAKSGCHDAADIAPDLSSTSKAYQSLTTGQTSNSTVNGVPYINTASPANSPFYLRIKGTTDGDQMPADGPPYLTPDVQAKILAWITAGAKNN